MKKHSIVTGNKSLFPLSIFKTLRPFSQSHAHSQCYIGETKRALYLRMKEHQANCRNLNQHSVVVDHSATGHVRRLEALDVTHKRRIAESFNCLLVVIRFEFERI